jgi:hypothetical protein
MGSHIGVGWLAANPKGIKGGRQATPNLYGVACSNPWGLGVAEKPPLTPRGSHKPPHSHKG